MKQDDIEIDEVEDFIKDFKEFESGTYKMYKDNM